MAEMEEEAETDDEERIRAEIEEAIEEEVENEENEVDEVAAPGAEDVENEIDDAIEEALEDEFGGNEGEAAEVTETEAELVEDEVPEEPEDLPVAQVGGTELATFTVDFGSFSFKIIPQSTRSGVQWAVWVFANNVQGPLLQTTTPISSQEAAEFGIPERLRERINEGLEFAQRELDLPDALRRELKQRSLEDLEALMQEE